MRIGRWSGQKARQKTQNGHGGLRRQFGKNARVSNSNLMISSLEIEL